MCGGGEGGGETLWGKVATPSKNKYMCIRTYIMCTYTHIYTCKYMCSYVCMCVHNLVNLKLMLYAHTHISNVKELDFVSFSFPSLRKCKKERERMSKQGILC